LLYGKVLLGDNTPSQTARRAAEKRLSQFDVALDGAVTGNAATQARYLFEYIPRDDNNGLTGRSMRRPQPRTRSPPLTASSDRPVSCSSSTLVFIGRGTVNGFATYSDGRPLAGAKVVAGSAGYNTRFDGDEDDTTGTKRRVQHHRPSGRPFTLSVSDADGNVTFRRIRFTRRAKFSGRIS